MPARSRDATHKHTGLTFIWFLKRMRRKIHKGERIICALNNFFMEEQDFSVDMAIR
jgi:hypothetical protein